MKYLIILYFADTPVTDIEETLKKFIKRDDIDIILINQNVRIFEVFRPRKASELLVIFYQIVFDTEFLDFLVDFGLEIGWQFSFDLFFQIF